ncbi:MAG: hypothetical protein SGI72_17965 [Planctomycetota bacterium]|nr:hypothetical protein [Planctomycetota bacterium]
MTATQPRVPTDAPAPSPLQVSSNGRVPVATTIVVFALVGGLLCFIAWIG